MGAKPEMPALNREQGQGNARGPSAPDQLLIIRNILIATDFSECSARALSYAMGIATRYEARLHLFHCLDPTPYHLVAPDAVQSACDAAWRDMQRLDSDLRRGLAKNVKVKLLLEAGDLAAILPQIVNEFDLNLIVVGTHGRTGWRKLVLGSVTEIVVDQASCPVLTVGPCADRTRLQQFGPENILLVSDASARSKLAKAYAFSLARKYGSRLTVLHLLEGQSGSVLARASEVEWRGPESRELVTLEEELADPSQLSPQIGSPSDVILQVADESATDLIVLTVPAGHKFAHRLLSTNAYQVLRGARCPVLAVHAQ